MRLNTIHDVCRNPCLLKDLEEYDVFFEINMI
jgi:hypothetical protein